MTEKPRSDDPADPVTSSPEEVAATDERVEPSTDPNEKADTTKQATTEQSG